MSDSDWWYLDLALVIALAGFSAFGLFAGVSGAVRIALASPLVLLLPGYALVSILFPEASSDGATPFDDEKTGLSNPRTTDGGIGGIERFILSVVLTVAIVPLVVLVSSATPWGVTLEPILIGVVAVTIVLSFLGILARWRCPPDRRFTASIPVAALWFTRARTPYDSTSATPFNALLALSMVVLLASAGYAIANPLQHDGFTEFAVETEPVTGETETMYTSSYAAGESQALPLAITNREHRETSYTTVVLLQRVTVDDGEVTITETDELARETATVSDGETYHQSIDITPTMAGDDLRLLVLLYEGEAPDDPTAENAYRVLRLPIEVS